jgi:fibronectin-binding autotransporter adhesin
MATMSNFRIQKNIAKVLMSKIAVALISVVVIVGLLVGPSLANAAFNKEFNYQGKLTNASGVAVADGTYNMEFALYTVSTAGTAIWTETRTGANKVTVSNGLFSVMLGEVTSLSGVDFNQTLYLGVNIGGTGSPSWDGEMTPRKRIGSVPAAVESERVGGFTPAQSATGNQLVALTSGALILGDTNPLLRATSTNTLTLQGGGVTGDLQFFSSSNKITSAGNLTLAGSVTLTAAPTTSAGSYDIITRNSSTGVLEKISSTAMPGGSGTTNYVARWTGTNTLGIGAIQDDGTYVGIGTTPSSSYKLLVNGDTRVVGTYTQTSGTYTGTFTINHSANNSIRFSNSGIGPFLEAGPGNTVSTLDQQFVSTGRGGLFAATVGGNAIQATVGNVLLNTSSGNTLIGTTTDTGSYKLDVNGAARVSGASRFDSGAAFSAIDTGWASAHGYSTNNYGVRLGADGTNGIIQVAQSTTAFNLKIQPYGGDISMYAGGVVKYNQTSTLTTVTNTTINLATANVQLAGVGVLKYSGTNLQFGSVDAGFNTLGLYTAGSERVRVDVNGNVGVGTTSPGQILHLSKDGGSSGVQMEIQDTNVTNAGISYFGVYQGNTLIQSGTASKDIIFWDTVTERVRIKSGGNVGIGTASPGQKLEVNGAIRITQNTSAYLQIGSYSTASDNFGYITSAGLANGTGLKFETTSGSGVNTSVIAMTIAAGGNVGIGDTTPAALFTVGSGDLFQISSGGNVTLATAPTTSAGTYTILTRNSSTGVVESISSTLMPSGSGTTNYVARWTGTNTLGTGVLYDNGTSVGIGTTSPTGSLHIVTSGSGAYNAILTGATGANLLAFRNAITPSADSWITYLNGNDLRFYNNGADRITFQNSGNVGIGTTSPTQALHVAGTGLNAGGYSINSNLVLRDTRTQAAGIGSGIGFESVYSDAGLVTSVGGIWVSKANATSGNYAFDMKFGTRTAGSGDISTRMTILSSGEVGIGDTSPAALFTVGSGDLFQVSSGGNVTLATAPTTSAGTYTILTRNSSTGVVESISSTLMPSGSGTTNYVARWTGTNTLGIGTLYDNGTNVAIGSTAPFASNTATGSLWVGTPAGNNGNIVAGGGIATLGKTSSGSYGAVGNNFYVNSSDVLKRVLADTVSVISFDTGGFVFRSAGNSTADSTISLSTLWTLNSSGHWIPGSNNSYDIGTSSAAARTVYAATNMIAPYFATDANQGNVGGTASTGVNLGAGGSGYPGVGYNIDFGTSANTYNYRVTDTAYMIGFGGPAGDRMMFNVAASGTGGATLTWTEAMSIKNTGNVGIGTTSPDAKLTVAGGTLAADGTGTAFGVTATGNSSATGHQFGSSISFTGAGSANLQSGTLTVTQNAGYTGTSISYAIAAQNVAAGTGNTVSLTSNAESLGNTTMRARTGATTTGTNYGYIADVFGGNVNYGVLSKATGTKNSATNIAVAGFANNAGTSPIHIGGYFGLNTSVPTYTSAGLIADNGAMTDPIFLGRDNGSTVFSIIDGGSVGIGTASPANKLDVAGSIGLASDGLIGFAGAGTALTASNYAFSGNASVTIMNVATAGTISMRVNNSGVAAFKSTGLEIFGSGLNSSIKLQNTGVITFASTVDYNSYALYGDTTNTILNTPTGGAISFRVNNAVKVTMDTSGNFGIGDSTPAALFTVGSGDLFQVSSGGNVTLATAPTTSAGTYTILTRNSSTGVVESIASTTMPSGSGTTNYLARWTGTNTLGIGATQDDGTNVGIGTAPATYKLNVNGTGRFASTLQLDTGTITTGTTSISFGNSNTLNVGGVVVGSSNTIVTGAGSGHVVIGNNNSTGAYTNGQIYDILIGSSLTNGSTYWGNIMLGNNTSPTGSGQMLIGSNSVNVDNPINTVYIGYGARNQWQSGVDNSGNAGHGPNVLISPSLAANGADRNGGTLTLAGGLGTGTGTPGTVVISTGTALTTGSTLQSLTARLTVNSTAAAFTVPVTSTSSTGNTLLSLNATRTITALNSTAAYLDMSSTAITDSNASSNTRYNIANFSPSITHTVSLSGTGSIVGISPSFTASGGSLDVDTGIKLLNISPVFTSQRHVNAYGLYIDPTYTSVSGNQNFTAIQTTKGNVLLATTSGSVGIGTTSPNNKLFVVSDITASTPSTYPGSFGSASTPAKHLVLGYDTTNDIGVINAVHDSTAWKNIALATLGGNVGIGTTSPGAALEVAGDIYLGSAADRVLKVVSPTSTGAGKSLTISAASGTTAGAGGSLTFNAGSGVGGGASGNINLSSESVAIGRSYTTTNGVYQLDVKSSLPTRFYNSSTIYYLLNQTTYSESFLTAQGYGVSLFANPQVSSYVGSAGTYSGQSAGIITNSGVPLVLGAGGAEQMRISSAGVISISNAPTTSAGTYTILTRNSSTGAVESITSTTMPSGSGTTNYVARWTGTNTLGTGVLYDNGTRVGVNTASPNTGVTLDVNGAVRAGGALYIDRASGTLANYLGIIPRGAAEASNFGNPLGSGAIEINAVSTAGIIMGTFGAQPVVLGTNNAERVRIDSSGNVGIGTTSPVSRLNIGVAPTASANYGTLSIGSGAFDGSTSGFFTGSSSGSSIAVNEVSGYAGDLLSLQVAGVNRVKFAATGARIATEASGLRINTNGAGVGGITFTGGSLNSNTIMVGNTGFNLTVENQNYTSTYAFLISTLGGRGTATSGNQDNLTVGGGFAPTSGTATYSHLGLTPIINQTGGANGISRGIFIDPTLTAAADFRALEMSNNAGFGIYQSSGNAKNYFAGNVGINTATPGVKLDVSLGADSGQGIRVNNNVTNVSAGLGVDGAATYYGTALFFNGTKVFNVESNGGALIGSTYVTSDAPANGLAVQGSVGIGTTSPGALLHVSGSQSSAANNTITGSLFQINSSLYVRVRNATAGISGDTFSTQIMNGIGAGPMELYTQDTANLVLGTNATERMRISGSTGNVGIGGSPTSTSKFFVTNDAIANASVTELAEFYHVENSGSGEADGRVLFKTSNTGGAHGSFYLQFKHQSINSTPTLIDGGYIRYSFIDSGTGSADIRFANRSGGTTAERMILGGNTLTVGQGNAMSALYFNYPNSQTDDQIVSVARMANTNWKGGNLSIQAGTAFATGSNLDGGTLKLRGGTPTGNGSSNVEIYTTGGGTSGTSDNTTQTMLAQFNGSNSTIYLNGNTGIGTTTPDLFGLGSGYRTLTVAGTGTGTSSTGILELATIATDASAYEVGTIDFVSNNNTSGKRMAYITAGASGATAANRGGYLAFAVKANGTANAAEAMRIDTNGNVGIGDTSPAALFTVGSGDLFQISSGGNITLATAPTTSAGTYTILTRNSTTGVLESIASTGLGPTGTGTSGYVARWTGTNTLGTGALRDTGTYVGVGVAPSGSYSLEIGGNTALNASSPSLSFINTGSSNKTWTVNGSGNNFTIVESGVGTPFQLSAGGNILLAPSTGDIGVGGNPLTKFTVTGQVSVTGSQGSVMFWSQDGSGNAYEILNPTGDDLRMRVGGYDRIVVQNGGNVGIGNSNNTYQLEVGSSSITGVVARFVNSTGTCDINPTTTALSCSSDERLKKNITNLDGTILDRILALRPVTYNWNSESNTASMHNGFIAQEVEELFPDLVSTDPNTDLKALNYMGLIPYTIKAVQEMNLTMQSLPVFEDQTLPEKVATFLRGIAERGEALVDSVKTKKVQTEELCVGNDGDQVCITKDQLRSILQQGQAATANVGGGSTAPAPNPEPTPEPTPAPETPAAETPVAEVAPAPEPTPEPTPAG